MEGKLVEKFSDRYASDVSTVIALTRKCISLNRTDVWMVEHGVRSESDLIALHQFLAKLAVELRHSDPTLPYKQEAV